MTDEKRYTIEDIKTKAINLAKEAGVAGQYPVDLFKVIKHLDFKCFRFSPSSINKSVSGAVKYNEREIYVNSEDIAPRQFFTIAHEIGHVVLHQGENKVDYRQPPPNSTFDYKEQEANQFAAELLMPAEEFKRMAKSTQNLNLLSSYFGVSKLSIEIRANHLGIDLNEYR